MKFNFMFRVPRRLLIEEWDVFRSTLEIPLCSYDTFIISAARHGSNRNRPVDNVIRPIPLNLKVFVPFIEVYRSGAESSVSCIA